MRFLTLAISYKFKGLCVAGLDYDNLNFVRLGKKNPQSSQCDPLQIYDLSIKSHRIRIGDLIDITVNKLPVCGCQSENYQLVKVNSFLKSLSLSDIKIVYNKLNHSNTVFCDCLELVTPQKISAVRTSIDFFKIDNLNIYNKQYNGKNKFKASFSYNNALYNNFSVTDCEICAYPSHFGSTPKTGLFKNAYITVTLPNDAWAIENGFYKYISGVII